MPDSSPFWNAYSSAVKNYLTPGVTLPQDNEIFVLPFTVSLTDASKRLEDESYNYLLFKLADTTLSAPGSNGSYAQELSTYLEKVDKSSLQDPQAKEELDQAEQVLNSAQDVFEKTEDDAMAKYEGFPTPPPKAPFEQWVAENYPRYSADKQARDSAKTKRDQAYNVYWGRVNTLQDYQDNIKKALDSTKSYRLYNMSVQEEEGDLTFAPKYSSTGLKDQLDQWLQDKGQDQAFMEVKVDSVTPPGVTPAQDMYLKLTTKGFRRFDIDAGRKWNVDGVKALYPKQETGAPDVLNPKYARSISLLIAYSPKLEILIKEDGVEMANLSSLEVKKPYVSVFGILAQHFPKN